MKKILIMILLLISCNDENNNAELKYIENWCINNDGLPYSYHHRNIKFGYDPGYKMNIHCITNDHLIFFIKNVNDYKTLLNILYGHNFSHKYESKLTYYYNHKIDRDIRVVFIIKNHIQKDNFDKINTLNTVHKKTFVHVNKLK